MAQRSAAEIRDSIESNRAELAVSLEQSARRSGAHHRLARTLERHQREIAIGAAVVGVLMLGRRRRRKRRRG